jgi:ADP-ribosyl-[dinitrogen reductase] hydrolase
MKMKIEKDKSIGMFIGLAVGDALGAPLEFQQPRKKENFLKEFTTGGVHNVSVGEWTDDTSMALALSKSIIEKQTFNADDIMMKFCKWHLDGEYSTRGRCFDIGGTVRLALSSYIDGYDNFEFIPNPYRGRIAVETSGNGAIMRMAPVIMVATSSQHAVQLAIQQTLLTHGSDLCVDYSSMLAEELYYGYAMDGYRQYKLPHDIDQNKVMSGGFVKETYQAAWWAFETTDCFEDCIIKAVNRGHDADTTGAVAGMIAGRFYGLEKIPTKFKKNLMWYQELYETANQLFQLEYKFAKNL